MIYFMARGPVISAPCHTIKHNVLAIRPFTYQMMAGGLIPAQERPLRDRSGELGFARSDTP